MSGAGNTLTTNEGFPENILICPERAKKKSERVVCSRMQAARSCCFYVVRAVLPGRSPRTYDRGTVKKFECSRVTERRSSVSRQKRRKLIFRAFRCRIRLRASLNATPLTAC